MNPTPEPVDADTEDDPQLVRAAQEYLAELEAGRRPLRAAFVARFPDLAGRLEPYLDALDMVHASAEHHAELSGQRAAREQDRSGLRPGHSPLQAAAEPTPEAIGDFHIVRLIGRGGMGMVYEAVQLSLGRRVALKVLPFAAALDGRQLQRFKNEAQAAAQLHHTNIVPVYAVGCERGVHYYAMQLIEGQNLADLIRQLRPQDREAPRSGAKNGDQLAPLATLPHPRGEDSAGAQSGAISALPPTGPEIPHVPDAPTPAVQTQATEYATYQSTRSTRFFRTAARLAAQAADALEHAHQFGVIHRDVKPANLIVDERGNVWVTDFGLAQFQTTQGLTRTGDLMGTLRYMSPEQAGGKHAVLDARTDVYSLGATLYELVTLRPLFDGADTQRLLKQILNDEPRPPRSIDRAIPPELETIVLKAVSKNPADRYATAQEFAADLRRFLDNRPILARPPSLAQRARKWARRHPSAVVAAVVLCVLTAVGALIAAWMIHQEQERTLVRAKQAEEALKLARQSANEMIQISEEELAGKPFMEGVRKRMLLSALNYYQGLIAQSADDPDAQKELAVTEDRVRQILADLAVLEGGARLDLLRRDDVQKDQELALTKEQLDQVNKYFAGGQPKAPRAGGRFGPDSPQQHFLDYARSNDAKLKEILSPPQQQRLGQIALQLQGLSAFHDVEIAATLKLTAEQKQRLREIEAEAFGRRMQDAGNGPAGQGPPSDQWFRALIDKYVAILTDDQKQRWGAMTGTPFKGWLGPVFRPPPGGRQGGPPPGAPGPTPPPE